MRTQSSHRSVILVVDDCPSALQAMSDLLRRSGFAVSSARSQAECLAVLRMQQPDVILLKECLPDGDGVEVCRAIKAQAALAGTFVALLSDERTSSDQRTRALEAGAAASIPRLINNRELVARVQSLARLQANTDTLNRSRDARAQRLALRSAELGNANAALMKEVQERTRAEQELRALSRRLVEVQEAERRFVACELHDEIGQSLTSLKLALDLATRKESIPPADLHEAAQMVNELMARVRQLSLDLRPQMLDDLGLQPALEWHFHRYTRQTGVTVDFQKELHEERLPGELETALFRLTQEALTNVARHSGARRVAVALIQHAQEIVLSINDDGVGFDPETVTRSAQSAGLSGMRERAELLGGRLTIDSAPHAGTRVSVQLPFTRLDRAANSARAA